MISIKAFILNIRSSSSIAFVLKEMFFFLNWKTIFSIYLETSFYSSLFSLVLQNVLMIIYDFLWNKILRGKNET